MDLKRETYRVIQEVNGKNTVIASATSAKFPTELQEGALYPEKILVGHPYNPSYLLPLMEVCSGAQTDQKTIDMAVSVYQSMRKVPIVCKKEVKGFIANKISWGVMAAAKEIVENGICSVDDVDKAIMYGPGMRFPVTGQLLTLAMGVEGGWKNMNPKYNGKPATEFDLWLDEELNKELANRPEQIGNNLEDALKFRDKMLVAELKVQGLI